MNKKEAVQRKKKNTGVRKKTSAAQTRSAQTSPASQVGAESQTPLSKQQQNPSVDKQPMQTPFHHRLAKWWMKLLSAVAGTLLLDVVATAVGLNTWGPSPLLEWVHQYPIPSIVFGSIILCITFLAWFLTRKAASKENTGEPTEPVVLRQDRSVLIATLISTTSVVICFALISVILLRPPWCPTLLCPAPKLILQPNSIHDETLEVYLQTIQSSTHLLPGDPATYTPDTLPTTTNALRVDTSVQEPYRIIIGIHSLQQGRYGLIIEQVALVITQASLTVPYPLHVWTENEIRDYHSNLYQALYRGQQTGASILANYILPDGRSGGHVQLVPGESDELDIQVMSRIVADLHFQVRVTYRVINESQERSITLRDTFEIIFSTASNWFPYHLQDGHLIAKYNQRTFAE